MSLPQTQLYAAPASIVGGISRPSTTITAPILPRPDMIPSLMMGSADKTEVRKVIIKNIGEEVPDHFVESLLRVTSGLIKECGPVVSWKRSRNEQDVPMSFGCCEFEAIEGVLRAMRVLNGMQLYDKKLEVKYSDKTTLFIRDFHELKLKQIVEDGNIVSNSSSQGRETPGREASKGGTHGPLPKRRQQGCQPDETLDR